MAAPAPTTISYPMSDAEMHGFLEAAFGVENCDLKANMLFNAACSSTASVWASVRAELQLGSQASLELHLALSEAVKKAAKAGKNKVAPKNKEVAVFDEDGHAVVDGVSIINGVCVDPSKAPKGRGEEKGPPPRRKRASPAARN